ncbi:MAG: beta-ketoacyl-ACP synthase II [Verrucomicrobia bacterium]|nr:beta-ketoacyl-ACP synthase II [Verrucomicrobiota bacterium]
MKNGRRVVITGLGVLAPNGIGVDRFWDGLVNGRSATGTVTAFKTDGMNSTVDAEIKDFDPTQWLSVKDVRRTDRFVHLAVAAAMMAVQNAGLDMNAEDPNRVGVLIGSGIGGIQTICVEHARMIEQGPRRISPFLIPMLIINMASGQVSIMLNAKGPNFSIATACATASHSIGEATGLIAGGEADVMVAGGSEAALNALGFGGFCAMKALSTRNDAPEKASRPFDLGRDGFVMGEGAGIVILEEYGHAKKRGAPMQAEIVGYGATADAYHMTAPSPCGEGGARCMLTALQSAGMNPEDIGYINAHGTSTPLNDKLETEAIKAVFGERAYTVPVSSTKSMVGHLLGAAGAVEIIAGVKTIQTGVIHPTINYETPDPECDLDYVPNTAREAKVDTVLSNSLGFGGHNATLIIKRV